jgi:hypothetical protein
LWILGDSPPLPKGMSWKSAQVEAVLRASQELLLDSSVAITLDEKVGVFRGMSLVPAALRARKNPDGVKLVDLLPADVYRRWLVQKKRYLGYEAGIENWRPIFAAEKLRKVAIRKLKLRSPVGEVIGKLVAELGIKRTVPLKKFVMKTDELRTNLKRFAREPLADAECFEVTLQLTEALSDAALQSARARAWASADLAGLSELPPLANPSLPCFLAMASSSVGQELVPADLRAQVQAAWIDAAMQSLANNVSTLAVVPLRKLLDEQEGYLTLLRARGYSVEAPR